MVPETMRRAMIAAVVLTVLNAGWRASSVAADQMLAQQQALQFQQQVLVLRNYLTALQCCSGVLLLQATILRAAQLPKKKGIAC